MIPAIRRRTAAAVISAAMAMSPTAHVSALSGAHVDEWWLDSWGISRIWPTTTGSGVTVAVLDSGVNANLPQLSGRVLPGGDMSGGNTDGRKDLDEEKDGHGTAMAALIASQLRGIGLVGVAPDSRILSVRVSSGPIGSIAQPATVDGIRFATDHGAQVISISLGFNGEMIPAHCPADFQAAIAYAAQHNVVVIAAAGNSGNGLNPHEYPASCAGVVAVGAVDEANRPWANTQRQDYVTVSAPGVRVGWLASSGKYYPNGRGTSMATALTPGRVALVRSAHPEMSARTIVQRMIATANPTANSLPDSRTGYGVFRIHRVLDTAGFPVGANAPNHVYQRLDHWMALQGMTLGSRGMQQPHAKDKDTNHKSLGFIIASVAAIVSEALVSLGIAVRSRKRSSSKRPQ